MAKLLFILIFSVLSLINSSKDLLSPYAIPKSYELSLVLNEQLNKTSFTAIANITFEFTEANHRSIVLNSKGLKLRSSWQVFRQGIIKIPHSLLEENLKAETINFPVSRLFDVGIPYSLIVEYDGVINDETNQGLFMRRYTNEDGEDDVMLMTQMAPTYLRNLIPCMDEPQFVTVFNLEVQNVPKGYEVISNGLPSTKVVDEKTGYEEIETSLIEL